MYGGKAEQLIDAMGMRSVVSEMRVMMMIVNSDEHNSTYRMRHRQIRRIDPRIVRAATPTPRAPTRAHIKRDDIVLCVEARVLHVHGEPGGVEHERVEHEDGGLGGVEGADGAEGGVCDVPERDVVVL